MEKLDDLMTWRKELNEEEQLLTKLIAQIDQQINCLMVEQMELKSAMPTKEVKPSIVKESRNDESIPKTSQELDLTIPAMQKTDMEEEEEEEEEDEDL